MLKNYYLEDDKRGKLEFLRLRPDLANEPLPESITPELEAIAVYVNSSDIYKNYYFELEHQTCLLRRYCGPSNSSEYDLVGSSGDSEGWFFYKNGIPHREDGPAKIYDSTACAWYVNGKFHRTDGPAWDSKAFKVWAIDGKRHRIGAPAKIYDNGETLWYQHDQLHRLDGPAIEYIDNIDMHHKYRHYDKWYIFGKEYTKDEFEQHAFVKKPLYSERLVLSIDCPIKIPCFYVKILNGSYKDENSVKLTLELTEPISPDGSHKIMEVIRKYLEKHYSFQEIPQNKFYISEKNIGMLSWFKNFFKKEKPVAEIILFNAKVTNVDFHDITENYLDAITLEIESSKIEF